MLRIDIPNRTPLTLSHLILDYNGTLAKDGALLDGVAERLVSLAKSLHIIVLTADTHGSAAQAMQGLPVDIIVIKDSSTTSYERASESEATYTEDIEKLKILERIGADSCAALGNGHNDSLMLRKAAISIALLGDEGVSTAALLAAQTMVKNIRDGLDLLLFPNRLRATLRC